MSLHEDIAKRLWNRSLKGSDAAEYIESVIAKYGIQS